MPKRLLLGALEGPVSQLDKAEESVNYILKNRFPDLIFKVFGYDPDYPEEVTYHLGQTMKFMSNGRFVPNGSAQIEEQSEEEKGWRTAASKFWSASKGPLREFGKEIWMNKQEFQKWKEEERQRKQKELDGLKGPLEPEQK